MTTERAVTTRDFVLSDHANAVALWTEIDSVEICEGDSREEVAEYLKRNPGLSRVAEHTCGPRVACNLPLSGVLN